MGIFGKIKQNWNDGSLMAGLQAAGAIAQGDYGTAAQIQALSREQRDQQRQADAQREQHEQLIAAAVRAGVPEEQARSLPPSTLASVVGQYLGPQQQANEYTYFDDNAGNRWRQNTRTGQVDQNPTFVDQNPRTFFDPSQNRVVTVPNSYAGGQQQQPQQDIAQQQGGAPPPLAVQALRANPQLAEDFDRKYGPGMAARVLGGGAGNGAGNFPGFTRIPGGQLRFP